MVLARSVFAGVACLLLLPRPVAAQGPLTLDAALQRARIRGPEILAAVDRIDEARARLRGASVLLQSNPEFEVAAGPRRGPNTRATDYEFGISQSFELGGRRGARMAAARAGVDRESAASRNVVRELLRDVSFAFYRVLAAQERVRLLTQSEKVAADLQHSMERRFAAGDVPVLDVNLARSTAARSRAERRSAEAALLSASGELRVMLGMSADEPLSVAGDIHQRRALDVAELLASAQRRPDLAILEAEITESESEARLGRGSRWPELGIGVSRERDEGDDVTKAGVSLTIPLFARGQEQAALGDAKALRLRRELESLKRAIDIDVRTALDVYNHHADAVQDLERDALPTMEENERLALRSYEEGEIGIAELLLIRRDAFETRLAYADRLLEAALAAVEVEARSGVLQ